ncbi:MAG: molybdopterin-guanine dinucleotide biosynthesis protein B [Planctomycetota bacterium]
MNPIHVIGRKNHGKTTLIVDLVGRLNEQGVRVGTIKHTSHAHELDTPGKDSHRHRVAGASPAAIVSDGLVALYIQRNLDTDCYDQLAPLFSDCDLVLVEGHSGSPAVKVEVWRREAGGPPLALARDDVAAVITDDPIETDAPVWPRSDLAALARHVLALLHPGSRP